MGNCVSCLEPHSEAELAGQLDKPVPVPQDQDCSSVAKALSQKQQQYLVQGDGRRSDAQDSANSNIAAGRADPAEAGPNSVFLQWAEDQASAERKPLDEFLGSNTSAAALRNTGTSSSSGSSGRPSLESWGSLFQGGTPPSTSSASAAPHQPFDAYLHGPPKPACHEERIVAANGIQRLRATQDGEMESMLDALCAAFGCDTASTTLLTGECITICAARGALSPGICPDRWGFCGWSFINTNHELLVVEDLKQDARFADNFFVCDPAFHLESYFAAPLISTDGHRLGTLCVMGQQPQKFDATRALFLANMAEMLVRQMECNWVKQLQEQKEGAGLTRSLACYTMAYMLVDVAKPGWRVMYMNKSAENQLGMDWASAQELVSSSHNALDQSKPDGIGLHSFFDLQQASTTWAPHGCEFTVREVQGAASTPLEGRSFTLTFRLATSDGLDSEQPFHVGVPSYMEAASDGFGRSLFFMQVSEAAESSCGGVSMASTAVSASAAPAVLSSWSAVLSNGESTRAFIPRGVAPEACPIEGLVMGPLLGKGSYGRVYRGVYKGVPVAVKMIEDAVNLRTTDAGEPLEAMLTQGIKHLGIMRTITYAYSQDRSSCWMLFEYCNCSCVQDACVKGWFRTDRRPTKGGINLRAVVLTAYEIASAMAFLHKHDIVHGDLKGGNVMLSDSSVNAHGFTAKVGDFGLARQGDGGPRCPPNMYGTVTHMPPEVLLKGQIGKPTDVYSFGVLLWEMLTGARAWAGMRHTQIICQVALLKRQLAVPEGLPPAIASLLARCMAMDVDRRCTFEEVLVVLSDFLQRTRNDDLSSVGVMLVKGAA